MEKVCVHCQRSFLQENATICKKCAERGLKLISSCIKSGMIPPLGFSGPQTVKDFKEIRRKYRNFHANFPGRKVSI